MLRRARCAAGCNHARATHFLLLAVAIGDEPVAVAQLRRFVAAVGDRDRVGEQIPALGRIRFAGHETGLYADLELSHAYFPHCPVLPHVIDVFRRPSHWLARATNSRTPSVSGRRLGSNPRAAQSGATDLKALPSVLAALPETQPQELAQRGQVARFALARSETQEGGVDLRRWREARCADVEQQLDATVVLRHRRQPPVSLAARCCGQARCDFRLQHDVDVGDACG